MPRKKQFTMEELCEMVNKTYNPNQKKRINEWLIGHCNVERNEDYADDYIYNLTGRSLKCDIPQKGKKSNVAVLKRQIAYGMLQESGPHIYTATKIAKTFGFMRKSIYTIDRKEYTEEEITTLSSYPEELDVAKQFIRDERNALIKFLKKTFDDCLDIDRGVVVYNGSYMQNVYDFLGIPQGSVDFIEEYKEYLLEGIENEPRILIGDGSVILRDRESRKKSINKSVTAYILRSKEERKRFDTYMKTQSILRFNKVYEDMQSVKFNLGYEFTRTSFVSLKKEEMTKASISTLAKELNAFEIDRFREYYKKKGLKDGPGFEYIIDHCLKIKR